MRLPGSAILVTKTKTRTKMIGFCSVQLKLILKRMLELKLYKNLQVERNVT